jgi:uncharacterized protein affecting Mg2+/Co2+ transport
MDESLWAQLLSFTVPICVVNLAKSCKRLYFLADSQVVWKYQVLHALGNSQLKENEFCTEMEKVKALISALKVEDGGKEMDMWEKLDLFREIKLTWTTLVDALKIRVPQVVKNLHSGANPRKLHDSWNGIPFQLKCLYLVCDGQTQMMSSQSQGFQGIFGGFSCYDLVVDFGLVSHDMCIQEPRIKHKNYRQLNYPFIQSGSPTSFGVAYAVHRVDGSVIRSCSTPECGKIASSLLEFLQIYSGYVLKNQLDIDPAIGISRFFIQSPELSRTVTRGIQITCSALFVPEYSREEEMFFAYQVTIECVSPDTPRCQLTTRHWECFDSYWSETSVVDGPGVIGLFPMVYYGMEIFKYVSRTSFASAEGGNMQGYFRFKILERFPEEFIDARIDPFYMKAKAL